LEGSLPEIGSLKTLLENPEDGRLHREKVGKPTGITRRVPMA